MLDEIDVKMLVLSCLLNSRSKKGSILIENGCYHLVRLSIKQNWVVMAFMGPTTLPPSLPPQYTLSAFLLDLRNQLRHHLTP